MERLLEQLRLNHLSVPTPVFTDPSVFSDMLKDEDRNQKYFSAIKSAVSEVKEKRKEKCVVLDLGCGTGLLTMMALAAGADQVYACDQLPFNIDCLIAALTTNGFSLNNVHIICKNSKNIIMGIDIPSKANILVTEIFDTELIGEDAISTINHAREHLLTADAITIPEQGAIYAQVVDCQMIRNLSILNPITVDMNKHITFPFQIEQCSTQTSADHAIALNELRLGVDFDKISPSLKIFEFNWRTSSSEKVPDYDCNKIPFIVANDGEANAIFSWWELELGYGSRISLRPRWAGVDNSNWRFHWQNSVHYGFQPLKVKEGNNIYLESFRSLKKYWFSVTQNGASLTAKQIASKHVDAMICNCHYHNITDTFHFGLQNEKTHWADFLRTKIVPGQTTCLCISDDPISLPLIAAASGAKTVWIIDKNLNSGLVLSDLLQNIGKQNGYATRIVSWKELWGNQHKVDLVIGDPYVQNERPRSLQIASSRDNPMVNLAFWDRLPTLPRNWKSDSYKVLPSSLKIFGLALNFDDFYKPFTPTGKVCGGIFDMSDFERIIAQSTLTPEPNFALRYHRLWQYPSNATSLPFNLFSVDMATKPELKKSKMSLILEKETNAFVFWYEFDFDGVKESTGLINDIQIGERPIWHKLHAQTVAFTKIPWTGKVDMLAELDMDLNEIFKLKMWNDLATV